MSTNIHFAMGGAIFGAFTAESAQFIAKHGLPGVEPYRGHLTAWLDRPQVLKDLLDEYGNRGYTGPTPTQAMHAEEILYKDLGAGGVDHPAIWAMLAE